MNNPAISFQKQYSHNALLLSGMPASGKDTITQALRALDPRIVSLRKHRAGAGGQNPDSYIDVTPQEFERLRQTGEFVQWHGRYDRLYGVSRREVEATLDKGLMPVIHVGRYENLTALRSASLLQTALSVLLLCSREETSRRLQARHPDNPADVETRLRAFDEERAELQTAHSVSETLDFDLILNVVDREPLLMASEILAALQSRPADDGRRMGLLDLIR